MLLLPLMAMLWTVSFKKPGKAECCEARYSLLTALICADVRRSVFGKDQESGGNVQRSMSKKRRGNESEASGL